MTTILKWLADCTNDTKITASVGVMMVSIAIYATWQISRGVHLLERMNRNLWTIQDMKDYHHGLYINDGRIVKPDPTTIWWENRKHP